MSDRLTREQDWYFTFGYGHDPEGRPGAVSYAVFHGTYGEARAKMVERFGTKWAFQYESAEAAGVERWNLERIR